MVDLLGEKITVDLTKQEIEGQEPCELIRNIELAFASKLTDVRITVTFQISKKSSDHHLRTSRSLKSGQPHRSQHRRAHREPAVSGSVVLEPSGRLRDPGVHVKRDFRINFTSFNTGRIRLMRWYRVVLASRLIELASNRPFLDSDILKIISDSKK